MLYKELSTAVDIRCVPSNEVMELPSNYVAVHVVALLSTFPIPVVVLPLTYAVQVVVLPSTYAVQVVVSSTYAVQVVEQYTYS